MWRTSDTYASGWDCTQCMGERVGGQRIPPADRGLIEARGVCGGPFTERLPGSRTDSQGRRYVELGRTAPGLPSPDSDERVYSCPVAVLRSHAVQAVLSAYRREAQGGRIEQAVAHPTAALTRLVDTLHAEHGALRSAELETKTQANQPKQR